MVRSPFAGANIPPKHYSIYVIAMINKVVNVTIKGWLAINEDALLFVNCTGFPTCNWMFLKNVCVVLGVAHAEVLPPKKVENMILES